jgi:hypothetical protein
LERLDHGPWDGLAHATSERLLIRGNGRRVRREWAWSDVASATVLRIGIGVRLELLAGLPAAW